MAVPEEVKPVVKDALEVVHQAAVSNPQDWENAVAAGEVKPPAPPTT